jgi:serine/threonine-protein kinase
MPGTSALRTLAWVDATGKKEPLQAKPSQYLDLRLSPDGRRVAVTTSGEAGGVSVYDPERDVMTRLTSAGPLHRAPTWTPDGRYVVFSSLGNGIFQARADGASQAQALLPSPLGQYPRSFTPDGTRVAFSENLGGGSQLWTVPLTQEGSQLKAGVADPFLKSSVRDGLPAFSPDGRWLAYQSDESGRNEIYVRAFPPGSAQGGKWQISNSGGILPLWSRGGHELVYQSGDQLMSVAYTVTGDTFVAERPRVWIAKLGAATLDTATLGAAMLGGGYSWDLAPDGKRVAVVTSAESSDDAPRQEHEVVFLQNFFDELRRRVPLGK